MPRRRIPAAVHDRRIPMRFRSWLLHFEDPVLVLREFIAWLESQPPAASQADGDEIERLESDRSRLVRGLIDIGDLVDSAALRHRVTQVLESVGVTAIDSAGERFDPTRHRAVDRVPTRDPSEDGRVAETERLGYSDRGRRARLPDVLVYHHDGARDAR